MDIKFLMSRTHADLYLNVSVRTCKVPNSLIFDHGIVSWFVNLTNLSDDKFHSKEVQGFLNSALVSVLPLPSNNFVCFWPIS